MQPIRLDVNRTLGDAHGDDNLGAAFVDERAGMGDKVLYHFVAVRRDIGQGKTDAANTGDLGLHSIAPRHRASERNGPRVVDDEAKTVAQERGDMKTGFERSDYRNIDGRLAAIDAEVEHAQRNHRVIALALGFSKGFDKRRRGHLDIRRAHAANVRRGGR